MRNAIKVMEALQKAFPGHKIENIYYPEKKEECIYFNDTYIGSFDEKFWQADFDNIEIKIKAPIKDVINFIDNSHQNEKIFDVVESCSSEGIIRRAIEKGLMEWSEES